MPKIIIDNNEVEFQNGMTVMQACEIAGIEIPRFCYHDKLSIAGNCRMCLVEMEKSPKPIASCAMPASEGMVIKTNTNLVKEARKGVMEFLLINHPLDCPICDQGGECDLQDQALYYGFDKSRYDENKRAVKNKNMGPLVSTIMTRCIHCTRCVRFSTEVAGVDDLGLLGRGENAEITTYLEKTIESELSGNVIDLCPVGALTSKPYAFKSRPWELKKTETYDVFDAIGSSIRVDTLGNSVLRVLPRINEEINEEWISDKTRFAIDGLSRQRLDKVYVKKNDKLEITKWDDALLHISKEIELRGQENTISISGKFTDVETLYSSKKFLSSIGSNLYDCRFDNAQFIEGSRNSYLLNSSIQNIENADSILLIGTNPRWEASVLNARIRKAYLQNNCKIGVIGKKLKLNYNYTHLSDSVSHLNQIIDNSSSFCNILKSSQNPIIILGVSAINSKDGKEIINACAQIGKSLNNDKQDFNPLNILYQDISRIGALDLGYYNSKFDYNFEDQLKKLLNKTKPVVFLLGQDELNSDLFKDCYVVYIGHHGEQGASMADIILPSPAYTEKTSTYVNMEGRVLQTTKCHNPIGQAKEEWKIFRALSNSFKNFLKFNNIQDLRNELIIEYPIFSELFTLPKINNSFKFDEPCKIASRELNYNINNFYMNDVISRSSETMAKCTKEILNNNQ